MKVNLRASDQLHGALDLLGLAGISRLALGPIAPDPSRLLPFGIDFGSKPIPLGAQFDGIYIDLPETVVVFGHCSQSPFGVQRNASALVPECGWKSSPRSFCANRHIGLAKLLKGWWA
ncbi:MAG: hypothetical protein E5Y25_05700 [Mesorhizobium sp.]|nr:MAG: hypothetical protein E5Y25_05700 [Mesorhizobium sp.]